jgi:heme O synthase-like polyprenyltransferase
MEPKTALVSVLVLASILIVWYGILAFAYTELAEFGMPGPAYIIVFGLLALVFVVIGAKIFVKE